MPSSMLKLGQAGPGVGCNEGNEVHKCARVCGVFEWIGFERNLCQVAAEVEDFGYPRGLSGGLFGIKEFGEVGGVCSLCHVCVCHNHSSVKCSLAEFAGE